MRRAIWIVLALAIGGFLYMGASHAQPQDPFFLVQTPQGVNITAGRNVPSLATTGNPPSDGSLHITTVAGGAPSLGLYDDSTQTWIGFLGTSGVLTNDFIPVWDSVSGGFEDSLFSDDGTNILATGGLIYVGTAVDATNSILIDGNNSAVVFEGTASNFETSLTATNPTVDRVITLPDFTGTVMLGAITDNTIPFYNLATGNFVDSLLTDDGTNITLASGQLLGPVGAVGTPTFSFTGDTTTGIYRQGASTLGVASGGTLTAQFLINSLRYRDGTVLTPAYSYITEGGSGVYRIAAANIGMSVSQALVMDWEDTNAAGAGADLVTISSTLGIMDGAPDFVRGLFVDLVSVDHTGGNIFGVDVDDIVADDDAVEAAVHLDASWDYALWVEGTTQDIDHGLTTAIMLSPVLAANDNANDQRNVLTIDVDIPNGSAGLINGINIDGVTDDIQTLDSAIFIEGGWDSQITFTDIGRAATANPLTGTVWMFLTDTTDYDGGAADCAIVFRDSAGGEAGYIIVVSNGVCP